MKQFSIFAVFIFAIFLLIGGAVGFVKAGSLISLVASVLSSLVMILSGIGMLKNKAFGTYSALIASVILMVVFGFRFANSGRFMPAGLVLTASVIVAFLVSLSLRSDCKRLDNSSK